jgi:hypothetical protein
MDARGFLHRRLIDELLVAFRSHHARCARLADAHFLLFDDRFLAVRDGDRDRSEERAVRSGDVRSIYFD